MVPGDPPEVGDEWVWVALAWESRLAVSFMVDKRTDEAAHKLLRDLRARVVGRPLLATDGYKAYPAAVIEAFGLEVDYGVMTTEERPPVDADPSATARKEKVRRVMLGTPDPLLITTAHIERSNLTLRMGSRRFTRKTNGFSKRLRHLRAAVALHYFFYNFSRPHESIKTTPAMRAGLATEPWPTYRLILG